MNFIYKSGFRQWTLCLKHLFHKSPTNTLWKYSALQLQVAIVCQGWI